MIDATELRLDNWVLGDGSPTQVTQMDFEQWTFDHIEPLPLTAEILQSSGFYKLDRFFEKDEILLLNVDNVYLYHYSNRSDKRATLKYVHQLQNLYFALTGEELEVDLRKSQIKVGVE